MTPALPQKKVDHCRLCGSTKWHYLFSRDGFRFVLCQNCRLIFSDTQPPAETLHLRLHSTRLELKISNPLTTAKAEGQDLLRLEHIAPESLSECRIEGLEHASFPRDILGQAFRLLQPGHKLTVKADISNSKWSPTHFSLSTLRSLTWSVGYIPSKVALSTETLELTCRKPIQSLSAPLLSIIVPVFNEWPHLQQSLPNLLAKKFPIEREIIIVESGSTDGSREYIQQIEAEYGIRVIYQPQAEGKGYAVRAGLLASRGSILAIQDADMEYDLEDYDPLLEPIVGLREAFVLGARHGGKNLLKMRSFAHQRTAGMLLNFGHIFFCGLVNVLFRQRLKDPFTMYKVFRRDCIEGLDFQCKRFDFDFELLIKIIQNGYQPVEIPVNYRSRSFHEGKKVRMFHDPLTWLRALILLKLRKI